MTSLARQASVRELASRIEADIQSLPIQNTPGVRAIRRRYTRLLKNADATFVYDLAWELMQSYGQRWVAYELIQDHKAAFRRIGEAELEQFGQGINSWWTVDAFARTLSGPAWLAAQVSDELFQRWAGSPDRWWRRAALVSTVALNVRSHGGTGDVPRTLAVCRLLVDDHDDTVIKTMSWALRELAPHNPAALEEFLTEYDQVLAALVKREVRNKLSTGQKNPRKVHD
jgi:3-methyladenine DNA glycosylase AlkD